MTNKEAVNWLINVTADIGKAEHRELWHYEQALTEIKEMLETMPERKRGRWIFIGDGYKCSKCRSVYSWWADSQTSNYCPNCGAEMKGE